MTESPKESPITRKTLPPRTPGALPHVDTFQANETVHWPTMTKTLFYTGLVLIMIGGRFFLPHEVFEQIGLMVMGAGMFFFVIGLWRGKIAMEDSQSASKDEPESGPAERLAQSRNTDGATAIRQSPYRFRAARWPRPDKRVWPFLSGFSRSTSGSAPVQRARPV